MTKTETELLLNCFLFSKDSESEILKFLESGFCEISSFSKGETVFGNPSDNQRLGILLSGKASALCTDCSKSSLKAFSAGELFGAASIFSPDNSEPFSHIRATSACKVLFITKDGVEKLLYEKPEKAITLAVKGMLPHNTIGANALTRLRVYQGTEHNHAAQKPEEYTGLIK